MIKRTSFFRAQSLLLPLFVLVLTIGANVTMSQKSHVQAASASSWQSGRIIDDGIFYNSSDMTVDQVQAFLNSQVPTCDTWGTQTSEYGGGTRAQYGTAHGYPPPYICLKNYYENPTTHANNLATGSIPDGSLSAAQIIVSAAQSYGISVRVLLATLQKESAGPLITDTWPYSSQYRNPMGYGCPDTAPCDPSYAGFYNQVTNAARQFSRYKTSPGNYRYVAYQNNSIAYNPSSSCGSSPIYLSTTATAGLYNYTPYQPDQAALNNLYGSGDSCSAYGNRNFWRIFTDWFGNTTLPSALKSPTSATVYMTVNGYKLTVPYMGMLQDYGISPQSIQTVSQSTLDAIPSPGSSDNVSPALSYIVKSTSDTDADGGSIYLISVGRKYQFTNMQQFNDFGFNVSNIAYLPLSFIQSIPGNGLLSNFVTSPYGSVFDVSSGQKRLILDNASYKSLNPSDNVTALSYFTADLVPSGAPIASREYLIRSASNPLVYLYLNGNYYTVPSSDTYNCWGFGSTQDTPLYILPQDNYASTMTPTDSLSCSISESSTIYLLNKANKLTIPGNDSIMGKSYQDAGIAALADKIPTHASPLKNYVRDVSSPAMWYITNGVREVVPTYNDFQLLGLTSTDYDVVDDSALSAIPVGSGVRLGTGSLVKADNSATVYVINGNSRLTYPTSDLFNAYKNSWDGIQTYSASTLDSEYPVSQTTIQNYFYDQPSSKFYLVDPNGCYSFDIQMLSAYGKNSQSITSAQTYASSLFPGLSLSSCKQGSYFVKQPGDALVYWVDSGTKYPINTWTKLVSKAQTDSPYVITVSPSILSSLTTGTAL